MSLSSVGSIPPINNTYPTTTDSVLVTNNDNITSNNNNNANNTTEGTNLLAKTENGGEQNEFAAETSNENRQSNPGIVYVYIRNRVLYLGCFILF